VGLESRALPNVDNDRSQFCPDPSIKSLWRNRKTAFNIHDRALLALRAAQNLDGRPSDGASAVPRGSTFITSSVPPQPLTAHSGDSRLTLHRRASRSEHPEAFVRTPGKDRTLGRVISYHRRRPRPPS